MQPFNVRSDLSQKDALEYAYCALDQALGIVDSIEDDIESNPRLQARVFAVESILESATQLVHHAMRRTRGQEATA